MDWKLPIFYKKSAAKTAHANTKGFVIKPILRTELIKFIHDADTPK